MKRILKWLEWVSVTFLLCLLCTILVILGFGVWHVLQGQPFFVYESQRLEYTMAVVAYIGMGIVTALSVFSWTARICNWAGAAGHHS